MKVLPMALRGETVNVFDNLYGYIWQGRGNNCNTYVIANALEGERPHLLVDPGHLTNEFREPCFEILVSSLEADGLNAEDVGLIVNTHSHPDHCEASPALAQKSAQAGGGGQTGRALIALHQVEEDYRGEMARKLHRPLAFEPDLCLREGDLQLGRTSTVSLNIIHTPGHSPGSVSIYWPDRRVLVTGDVVFYGAIGRTDLPGGDSKLLKQSIERLSELDVQYLLPGHSTQFGAIIEGSEQVQRNFAFIEMNYFPML
ncbi:MAG: MBL fold metallo-hydrolase [Chloroflexota bacterium]